MAGKWWLVSEGVGRFVADGAKIHWGASGRVQGVRHLENNMSMYTLKIYHILFLCRWCIWGCRRFICDVYLFAHRHARCVSCLLWKEGQLVNFYFWNQS